MAGTAVGGMGPLLATLANKKATPKEINAFKKFGKDALAANKEAKDYVARMRDNALKRLKQEQMTAMMRNRNMARGINTQRALDLGTFMASNEAATGVSDVFSKQMMQILGRQEQLENIQDQMVMQGEDIKRQRTKADIDAYYSNLSDNLSNLGSMLQKYGVDINSKQVQQDMLDILPDLTQHGLTYVRGKDGKLEVVKVKK